jgi:hypothetical protein
MYADVNISNADCEYKASNILFDSSTASTHILQQLPSSTKTFRSIAVALVAMKLIILFAALCATSPLVIYIDESEETHGRSLQTGSIAINLLTTYRKWRRGCPHCVPQVLSRRESLQHL